MENLMFTIIVIGVANFALVWFLAKALSLEFKGISGRLEKIEETMESL